MSRERHFMCGTCWGERQRKVPGRRLDILLNVRKDPVPSWDGDPTHYCCICGSFCWDDYTFEYPSPRGDCCCKDPIDPEDLY